MMDKFKRHVFYGIEDTELTDQLSMTYPTGVKRERVEQLCRLFHAIVGLQGELGEVLEKIAECIDENKELDVTNLREEGGDLMWYLNLYFACLNTSFLQIGKANIAKLSTRYKDKFQADEAVQRDTAKEMSAHDAAANFK